MLLALAGSLGSRRLHRKTVTFQEECDVVEFEPRMTSDTSYEQQDRHDDDDGFFRIPEVEGESEQAEEDSFNDISLNPGPLSIEYMPHVAQSSPPAT